jgi:hypothetical protein
LDGGAARFRVGISDGPHNHRQGFFDSTTSHNRNEARAHPARGISEAGAQRLINIASRQADQRGLRSQGDRGANLYEVGKFSYSAAVDSSTDSGRGWAHACPLARWLEDELCTRLERTGLMI